MKTSSSMSFAFVLTKDQVPMAKARERLGDEKAGNSFVYTGNNSLLMHYPIDGGETINIVAMNTSKRSWNEDSWVVPANFAELDETFKNYEDRSRRVIDVRSRRSMFSSHVLCV